jgi:3-carboxy-cis,cis-muconate cycloisomerase
MSCIYITSMGASVRQLSASLYEAMVADHERSTGPWEIEWIVLPQICTLTHATLKHTAYLTEGLQVHPEAMQKNLSLSKGTIVSEAVMMGLGSTLGRQVAHDLVYDLCRRCVSEGRPLVELLLEDEEVKKSQITEEELRAFCDPANYLGLSVEMVERVLKGEGKMV